MEDIIIIGSGPAGLSAALYTCRAKLKTVVIGKDNGALEKADLIENYFGLEKPLSGLELVQNGKKQVLNLGGTIFEEEVIGVSWNKYFEIETTKRKLQAKAVLIATGSSRKKVNIENLESFEGKGVSYCAICDAFFYRNKDVAVLGNGAYALKEIQELLPVVKSVTLLTNGLEPAIEIPKEVNIIKTPVKSLSGENILESIQFADDKEIFVSGLFMALGNASASDLAKKLGALLTPQGLIKVNEYMETNIKGLFAAGDCTGGLLQISKAVGEGAKASQKIISYVRNFK